jgi:hypothetical protein
MSDLLLVVIAGLDPAIQARDRDSETGQRAALLDRRVKPGDDNRGVRGP